MPRKAKRQGRGAKKRARQVRRQKRSITSVIRFPQPNGLPPQIRCGLVYSDLSGKLATTVGVGPGYTSYRLGMNDIFDPDSSGIGDYPPLYNNMTALYQKWRVNSVKCTVYVENFTNFPTYVTLVGVFDPTTNSPASPTNPNTYDLMALPVWQRSDRKRVATVQVGDKNMASIVKRFHPSKIVGQNYQTSVNYSGEAGSSPAKICFIDIIAQTGAPSSDLPHIGLWMSYKLEYDVTFYNQNVIENATYD